MKQFFDKEGRGMDEQTKQIIAEHLAVGERHPEKIEIFRLEAGLLEAGFPYFFNLWDDMRPTPFKDEPGDPDSDINWELYEFHIEVGQAAGYALAQISVVFDKDHPGRLELLDMTGAEGINATAEDGTLYKDLSAEDCLRRIVKYFDSAS